MSVLKQGGKLATSSPNARSLPISALINNGRKAASANFKIWYKSRKLQALFRNYVPRSKQRPRAHARLEATWVMVFQAVVYVASATRAATNSDYSTTLSSSFAALHGQTGNSNVPGRVLGPIAKGGRQVPHRAGDWLTSPAHQARTYA